MSWFYSRFYKLQDTCLEKEISPADMRTWFGHLHASWEHNSKTTLSTNSTDEMTDYNYNKLELTLCSHTQWSSLFPDPKSSITGIDDQTGVLIP